MVGAPNLMAMRGLFPLPSRETRPIRSPLKTQVLLVNDLLAILRTLPLARIAL